MTPLEGIEIIRNLIIDSPILVAGGRSSTVSLSKIPPLYSRLCAAIVSW